MDPTPAQPRVRRGARAAWGIVRLAAAALIAAAVVAQLAATLQYAAEHAQHLPTVLANFFSFFTVLSNVIAVIALVVAGVWILSRGLRARTEPRWITVLVLAAGTFMVTTGVVYNVLLRGIPLPQGTTVPWSNEVLHVVGPLLLLVEVLLRVARGRIGWGAVWGIVAFPIVWVVYTLARGEHVTSPATGQPWWYPYPFLNPYVMPEGYIGVAGAVLGIAAAIVAVACLAVWWTRRAAVGETASTHLEVVE